MQVTETADSSVLEFLIVAALERYHASWDQLIQDWFDRDRCEKANHELNEIRKLAAALPRVSADFMELTMRHAQLLRALMKREGSPQRRDAEVAALRHKHRAAIEAMRTKCMRLLASAG